MRPGGALFALLASLLLLLRLLWSSTDEPARPRLLVEESRVPTHGTPAALRTLRSPATSLPRATNSTYLDENSLRLTEQCTNLQDGFQTLSNKTKRYSEDDYLQIITNIQSCPWKRQVEEYENFRAELTSCCDAVQNLIVSQNNTPVGTNMSYEVESKNKILIRENIFSMFPVVSKDLLYGNLKEKKAIFLEDVATYGDTFLLLPAFSFRANTGASFKVYNTLKESNARQKVIYFHPKYLRNLALFWRTKGVTEYRLSSGLMITSMAVELCEHVKLYGFWPFSKTVQDTPVSHHYYDNNLPKRGFHEMPQEYSQILQLHVKGILKLQFSKCEMA
ncbi:PREDICTED: alpha-2,8-sialyltransferase 8F [Hipposideros armiger]|uniref:Alpha-2,8-sialyltransferase 8F n=1 Tax=Hipposideros armiger TaxID=186990 RepID=A0A8B7T070_HIPAR|nr:PREDICTED: alpha-2,8-sialyltransferase 8F [Hipposideros armiger]